MSNILITKKYSASLLGLIFCISCFLLYYSFVVPLFIIFPVSWCLESIFNGIFPKFDYAQIGTSVIVFLSISFLLVTILFFSKFIHQRRTQGIYRKEYVLVYMFVLLFIIHPLFFYLSLSNNWSRASDGQFIMSVGNTFQISSYPFAIVGILIDVITRLYSSNFTKT
jgi:hypothetical protein